MPHPTQQHHGLQGDVAHIFRHDLLPNCSPLQGLDTIEEEGSVLSLNPSLTADRQTSYCSRNSSNDAEPHQQQTRQHRQQHTSVARNDSHHESNDAMRLFLKWCGPCNDRFCESRHEEAAVKWTIVVFLMLLSAMLLLTYFWPLLALVSLILIVTINLILVVKWTLLSRPRTSDDADATTNAICLQMKERDRRQPAQQEQEHQQQENGLQNQIEQHRIQSEMTNGNGEESIPHRLLQPEPLLQQGSPSRPRRQDQHDNHHPPSHDNPYQTAADSSYHLQHSHTNRNHGQPSFRNGIALEQGVPPFLTDEQPQLSCSKSSTASNSSSCQSQVTHNTTNSSHDNQTSPPPSQS